MYRLNIVAKDVVGGNMNNYEVALNVPHFDAEKLASSSLILADLIEKVPTKSIGTGQFVIGDTKVRPRLTNTFSRDEKMGIYLQVYNFTPDEKTQKPNGSDRVRDRPEAARTRRSSISPRRWIKIPGASSTQVTIEKLLPLKSLHPGQYTLKMKVTDKIKNQTLTPSAKFTVN